MDNEQKLTLKISLPFIIAFIALRHLIHELHETSHMLLGRLWCGEWGTRDFNNVQPISKTCINAGTIPNILEGPMVNYILIWVGALLIKYGSNPSNKSWGISLIFASLPLARVITALFGGGDEMGTAQTFIQNAYLARLVVLALMFIVLAYPLTIAFKSLCSRHRIIYFMSFLILPMLLEGFVVLLFFNHLLKIGIMDTIWFMGMPKLVVVVLIVDIIILLVFANRIKTLIRK
ncbi:MAG: hypothetical protein WC622_03695 [Pedobacter sp.]|jgi:hypothetical protein|uniref:hypothetical protein n=1 Tax=Pedobacter sp. TaxID=1411316 RepID=UPI003569D9B4